MERSGGADSSRVIGNEGILDHPKIAGTLFVMCFQNHECKRCVNKQPYTHMPAHMEIDCFNWLKMDPIIVQIQYALCPAED